MYNFTFNMHQRAWILALLFVMTSIPSFAQGTFTDTRKDFRDESIYFMMTTRFYDGDKTNNVLCWDNQTSQISTSDPCWRGDFAGVIEKLDYIKALGFTAIWITPIVQNASGYDYHGYHAMDFSKVDLRYESRVGKGKYGGYQGTEDVTFQSLIDAAHAKGIKIILDIVLNHTGNFGENRLCKEFDRSQNIMNQADIDQCMIPDYAKLPSDYLDNVNTQYAKRLALMKNTDGVNHDTYNYWHHVGSGWNWDETNRWWGQIAGDCVDLNTENAEVAQYLVDCYGKFIEMGVDGFRIDTSGHISRLSFNSFYIPKFKALGEKYASKRVLAGQTTAEPFYMFGEICARYSGVTYRDQPNLSPYYYTWASDASLVSEWTSESTSWSDVEVKEGADPLKNMLTCDKESNTSQESNNTFMVDGAYHTPDYSQSSGFNVIDFPLHYNFTSASSAYGLAAGGDKYYNDATYNVVYVDSHDYGPQPNDGVRFTGSDEQWAENLSLMFTFRGIPCIYYGSEIGFRRGSKIDNGPNGPLSDTGRAYYGGYITGNINATDFGQYTADGNAQTTLSQPLARHLEVLNKVRQAVPALRRGQWTSDGCSGSGISFKRDCGDGHMACVVLGGTATFSGLPSGTWTNVLTGDTQSGSSVSASAEGQGNVAVYVLNYTGKSGSALTGGQDSFIYGTNTVEGSYDGNQEAGTEYYITMDDAVGEAGVTFSKTAGSYTDDELTVKAYLSSEAASGWVSVNGGSRIAVAAEGTDIQLWDATAAAGTTVTVTWGATSAEGEEKTGSVEYKKVGVYTPALESENEISVFYETEASISSVGIWVWNSTTSTNYTGGVWASKPDMEYMGVTAEGKKVYKWTYTGTETTLPTNVIFLPGGVQSKDLNYTNHGYYVDGVSQKVIGDVESTVKTPTITFSKASGTTFYEGTTLSTTITVANATTAYYTIDSETEQHAFTGSTTIEVSATTTISVYAENTDGTETKTAVASATYTQLPKPVSSRMPGDVNGDNVIDVLDYSLLSNIIKGIKAVPTADTDDFVGADADGNGTIGATDLTALRVLILNNIK